MNMIKKILTAPAFTVPLLMGFMALHGLYYMIVNDDSYGIFIGTALAVLVIVSCMLKLKSYTVVDYKYEYNDE